LIVSPESNLALMIQVVKKKLSLLEALADIQVLFCLSRLALTSSG
jgi:hypothetical protein